MSETDRRVYGFKIGNTMKDYLWVHFGNCSEGNVADYLWDMYLEESYVSDYEQNWSCLLESKEYKDFVAAFHSVSRRWESGRTEKFKLALLELMMSDSRASPKVQLLDYCFEEELATRMGLERVLVGSKESYKEVKV